MGIKVAALFVQPDGCYAGCPWVDVWDEVDKHDDAITDVRLAQMQMETKFLEIIRRLDELKKEIERWEPSPRG